MCVCGRSAVLSAFAQSRVCVVSHQGPDPAAAQRADVRARAEKTPCIFRLRRWGVTFEGIKRFYFLIQKHRHIAI